MGYTNDLVRNRHRSNRVFNSRDMVYNTHRETVVMSEHPYRPLYDETPKKSGRCDECGEGMFLIPFKQRFMCCECLTDIISIFLPKWHEKEMHEEIGSVFTQTGMEFITKKEVLDLGWKVFKLKYR